MDGLKDWPEPVVRVQTLSEAGVTSIPDRYVKPLSERPTALDCTGGGGTEMNANIPLIDMGGGDCLDKEETMRQISDACRNWGFFQVVNHGVAPELLRRTREVWREFFHLPLEFKQAYANSPTTYEGYGSRLGVEKGAKLDWGDYFFLHVRPDSMKKKEKWPSLPSDCRDMVDEYGRQLVALGQRLMRILAVNLGLPKERLQAAFGGDDAVGACLRVNYYPKCPQPDLTLGLSPHSDPGGLTLLLPDDHVTGLQVRRGSSWVTVKPAMDSIIVNVGDQIQVLSNANYKSVEHRVVVNPMHERLSLAFFYNPRSDLPIGPLPELVSDDWPALYESMTFNEYRLYIRMQGPKGKSQVESLKASRSHRILVTQGPTLVLSSPS